MAFAHSESPNTVRATLGAVLRRRREASERSLAELAGAAGMSPGFLSEVERGRKDVSTERLVGLASALGLPVAEIYLDLARELQRRQEAAGWNWPQDPRMKLQLAARTLPPQALRSVADFSVYLAMTQASPPRRRIGFTIES